MDKFTGYLIDGRVVEVFDETQEYYLCHFVYEEEDDESAIVSSDPILIRKEKVFKAIPTEKFASKIADLNQSILKLTKQEGELINSISDLQKQKSQLEKGFIDLSSLRNANRITVFKKDRYSPVEVDLKKKQDLKLSIEIKVVNGEMRTWVYNYYYDSSWGSGDIIDSKYGFLIDKTDEEILAIAQERSKTVNNDCWLMQTDDKYLAPEMIEKKKKLIRAENETKIEKVKAEIGKLQAKIEEMEA